MTVAGVRLRRVELPEVGLNVAEAGLETGPPTILLHGFPEFWFAGAIRSGLSPRRVCG